MVKIRYRQPDQACEIVPTTNGQLMVNFDESQRAVAPGQFAVFYDGDRCLGGAVIDRVVNAEASLRRTG
jgi:tRNA-specific 2-thiouridylase